MAQKGFEITNNKKTGLTFRKTIAGGRGRAAGVLGGSEGGMVEDHFLCTPP